MRRRLHRILRRMVLFTVRQLLLLRRVPRPGERPRVRVLLQHAHGMGGTIRTVLNLSGHLARDHDIEIVSVVRSKPEPFFPIPPNVHVRFADDRTAGPTFLARLLSRLPSVITPIGDPTFKRMNLYTDLRLLLILCGRSPSVLVGTRPSLNLLAAELAPRGTVSIGQDHMNLDAYHSNVRREITRSYHRLDALSVLTEHSRAAYTSLLQGSQVRIELIPNAVPKLAGGPSARDAKVILAAGRLTTQKGFDLLIQAYEPLAAEFPDWTLRIFGSGPQRAHLKTQIAEKGLKTQIALRGRTPHLADEMTRASIHVLSSRFEGLPMVIIEAMSKGLPVVAFDCPTGPAEMIIDGVDGVLVPAEDVQALTAALRKLMADAALRHRLGDQACRSSQAYDPDLIATRWTTLIRELITRPS
ncbi:glycosyltransferase family 4 protein [Actinomadura rudentiformis]|uniref:Glycosyltransferase family 4 protein n=1 Tax=Actinomadura rudentiformis TaxID=359158 RepID=A0A6H9YRJ0_9ACTN|nr:glycosyltransferase family 4 protein [Actinomadura rudentiformis]KAB2350732.1 glycosyltransferase family 4 protein [Actinomadura rudentiformis]